MQWVKWITYKNKKILLSELSNATPEDWPEINEQYEKHMKGAFENSILALVCVEGVHFDSATVHNYKERAKKDTPYIKKTAVVGITGLKKVIYDSVMKYARRDGKTFDSRELAKEWLVFDE